MPEDRIDLSFLPENWQKACAIAKTCKHCGQYIYLLDVGKKERIWEVLNEDKSLHRCRERNTGQGGLFNPSEVD
jgi:hypothetical protein